MRLSGFFTRIPMRASKFRIFKLSVLKGYDLNRLQCEYLLYGALQLIKGQDSKLVLSTGHFPNYDLLRRQLLFGNLKLEWIYLLHARPFIFNFQFDFDVRLLYLKNCVVGGFEWCGEELRKAFFLSHRPGFHAERQ